VFISLRLYQAPLNLNVVESVNIRNALLVHQCGCLLSARIRLKAHLDLSLTFDIRNNRTNWLVLLVFCRRSEKMINHAFLAMGVDLVSEESGCFVINVEYFRFWIWSSSCLQGFLSCGDNLLASDSRLMPCCCVSAISETCRFCVGAGNITVELGLGEKEVSKCINCDGAGSITCTTCQGSGVQPRYLDRRFVTPTVHSTSWLKLNYILLTTQEQKVLCFGAKSLLYCIMLLTDREPCCCREYKDED
jgi:hypothetical protein